MGEILPYNDFGFFSSYKKPILKNLVDRYKVRVIVELGSFLGKSTRYFGAIVPSDGKIYAIDHWLGSKNHQTPERRDVYPLLPTLYEQFLSNIIHANLCNKIIPIRSYTVEATHFIDASHEYEDVFHDLHAWYPKVKSKGIISGDDWFWEKQSVKNAVIKFANEIKAEVYRDKNIWCL